MGSPDAVLVDLRAVLARLAAPAGEQVAYLEGLGVAPSADELALELADAVGLLPGVVEAGLLPRRQAERIRALDRKLAAMSGQPGLWSVTALEGHPDWAEVRRLAAALATEPHRVA